MSQELYKKNYERMKRALVSDWYSGTIGNNPDVIKYIAKYKINTKISYLQSIVVIEKLSSGLIYDYFIELKRSNDTKGLDYNENEMDNMVTLKDVEYVFECSKPGTFKHLLLALYYFIPPLRQGEYINTTFTDDGTNNFVDITNSRFVMRKYKTSNKYGERLIHIPPKLLKIILDYKATSGSNYLLGKLYSSSGITKMLNGIFGGKKVSIDMLRKSYITEKIESLTMPERKDLAHTMGHGIETQHFIYNKKI